MSNQLFIARSDDGLQDTFIDGEEIASDDLMDNPEFMYFYSEVEDNDELSLEDVIKLYLL